MNNLPINMQISDYRFRQFSIGTKIHNDRQKVQFNPKQGG